MCVYVCVCIIINLCMYIILLFSSKEGFEIVVDLIKVDLKKKPLIEGMLPNFF
jgi:hypothetical protein